MNLSLGGPFWLLKRLKQDKNPYWERYPPERNYKEIMKRVALFEGSTIHLSPVKELVNYVQERYSTTNSDEI